MVSRNIIGGVFALDGGRESTVDQSMWDRLVSGSEAHYLFHNARSAIAYIVNSHLPKTFWVPAYICNDVADLSKHCTSQLKFYPIDDQLNPDIDFLDQKLESGDVTLIVNYFGQHFSSEVVSFVRSKDSVVWVEDCAHVLVSDAEPVGRYRVFSPRKLVGVPDGGLLIDYRGKLVPPNFDPLDNINLYTKPYVLRAEMLGQSRNDLWFPAYQNAERLMHVSLERAAKCTRDILQSIDPVEISCKRIDNFNCLLGQMEHTALIKQKPMGWVPAGFPIVVRNRNSVLPHLFNHKIFAQSHWSELRACKSTFSFEHSLSSSLVTLPCDQRYSEDDMIRIVDVLKSICL